MFVCTISIYLFEFSVWWTQKVDRILTTHLNPSNELARRRGRKTHYPYFSHRWRIATNLSIHVNYHSQVIKNKNDPTTKDVAYRLIGSDFKFKGLTRGSKKGVERVKGLGGLKGGRWHSKISSPLFVKRNEIGVIKM